MTTADRIRIEPAMSLPTPFEYQGTDDSYEQTITQDVHHGEVISRYEIITPNSVGTRRQWKSFQHYLCESSNKASLGSIPLVYEAPDTQVSGNFYLGKTTDPWFGYNSIGSTPFGPPGQLHAGLTSLFLVDSAGNFVPAPTDLDGLVKRALASMLPIIKAELSLPNFIYELKDFKRPAKNTIAFLKGGSFSALLKKYGKASKNLTFKQLVTGAAGHYLNTKFNILPLISDIAKLYNAMSRTERRINDFITRAGRPQNKHYRFLWTELPDSVEELPQTYALCPGLGSAMQYERVVLRRSVTCQPTRFNAQIQYNYNYTGFQTEHAQLLGHLDALGLNLNPAIIWNALPWTFVVDWVLGVSPYLNSLKSENMKPLINIRRFLWSVRRQRRIVLDMEISNYRYGKALILTKQTPTVVQTAYRRQTGFPSLSLITSSGLSSEELSLGAALAIVQSRRRTRR